MEREYFKDYTGVIGCDEVGRGPIAGPVNACAVRIISPKAIELLRDFNVTDSKKLTDKKRNLILEKLGIHVKDILTGKKYIYDLNGLYFEYCVTEHSHEEIDQMNILKASLSAMKMASHVLAKKNELILIDGNKTFESDYNVEAIVKGDSKMASIGMASIIAKVFRDEKMKEYDVLYPGYHLSKHAGYPTKEHKLAVEKIGPSPIHRKTFKGVKEFIYGRRV